VSSADGKSDDRLEDLIECDELFEQAESAEPLPLACEVAKFIRHKHVGDLGRLKFAELLTEAIIKGQPDSVVFYAAVFGFYMKRPMGQYAKREILRLIEAQRGFLQ
jgi:hypothetical protein